MVLGLVASVALASGSLLKAFTMIVLGPAAGPGRHRRRDRHAALHLRSARARRRAQLRGAGDGRVRAGRDHPQPRARAHPQRDGQARQRADGCPRTISSGSIGPVLRGTGLGSVLGILPGGGAMLASFAAYTLEKRLSPNRAAVRQGGDRGRGGARGRQQCRGADLVHPDADPGHPLQPGDGPDDRGPDHPGHHARPQRGHRRAGPVLGPDRLDVGRQPDAGAA